MKFSRLSLLWKILLPTSLVMTLAFAITGWLVQRDVVRASYASVEQEAKASFQAYESLWKARANRLGMASEILSTMSDVRAAFGTQDAATIRDTAGELWSRVSDEDAFFLVADGQGRAVASLGQPGSFALNDDLPMVRAARARFPKQASGFVQKGDELFQVVVTPVYVQSSAGPVLLNALVAGYRVDRTRGRKAQEFDRRQRVRVRVAESRGHLHALACHYRRHRAALAQELGRHPGLRRPFRLPCAILAAPRWDSSSFCGRWPARGSGWLACAATSSRYGCWRWWPPC